MHPDIWWAKAGFGIIREVPPEPEAMVKFHDCNWESHMQFLDQ